MLMHMSSMRMVFHQGKILLMECIPLGLECSIHQKFKWRCSRAFAHPRVLQGYVSITTTPSTWNDFFSEAYHYHSSSNLEKEEALGYFLSILLYTNYSATNGIYPVLGQNHAHPDEQHEHGLQHGKDLPAEYRHPLGLGRINSPTMEKNIAYFNEQW